MGNVLEIRNLKKSFDGNGVLDGISLSVREGEVIVVVGPSGCGKSTLLRCVNGLEQPDGGEILLDGRPISAGSLVQVRRQIGMVFQSYDLFPHMDVLENLTLGPVKALKRPKAQVEEEARQALKRVGLEDKLHALPRQLSGGQKQRVALVRAMMMHPRMLLLDEITAALDPEMVREVLNVVLDLARDGMTMLIVTHEMQFARAICSRVFYMDQGGIYEDGSPEQVFDNPQRDRTRQFIRRLKVLELTVDSQDYDFIGAGAEIDRYCQTNMIPSRVKYRIRLAFEELVQQMLWSVLKEQPLTVTVEYAEAEETATVTVRYGGGKYDPAEGDNTLSYKFLKSSVEELTYAFDPDAALTNTIRVRIRE